MPSPVTPPQELHSDPIASLVDSSHLATPTARPIPRPASVNSKSRWIWPYLVGVILFHLLIPLAFLPSIFSWWGVGWLFLGNYLICSLGIGAGYHRLHTHRGYKCPLWFERFLAILGCMNLQDTPARWVLIHRLHHQHSDEQEDPHTPMVSWFWSHVGWLFIENQETQSATNYEKYAKDMLRDPVYMGIEKKNRYWLLNIAQGILFFLVGLGVGYGMTRSLNGSLIYGAQWFLWGFVYRIVFTWHVTWGVNSFSHMCGYRNYQTRDDSRNNWLFAFLTNGEGWHNNHHADPRSASQGHAWYEFDVTYLTILFWEKIGLVWDVVRPSDLLLNQKSTTKQE